MANKEHQPRKLTQSELEELIDFREKNRYLEAELAYLIKLEALIQKEVDHQEKDNIILELRLEHPDVTLKT